MKSIRLMYRNVRLLLYATTLYNINLLLFIRRGGFSSLWPDDKVVACMQQINKTGEPRISPLFVFKIETDDVAIDKSSLA